MLTRTGSGAALASLGLLRRAGPHRRHWRLIYLDSAATTLRPRPVVDAVCRYYTTNGANIHRGKHLLSEEASDQYERVRIQTAEFVGARSEEIVFVRNTTEALNMVAADLDLNADDLVLGSLDAHHSNLLPWRVRSRLRLIPVRPDGGLDLAEFERALAEGPRVVALTACSNVTGVYSPLDGLIRLAKQAGAIVVVDAAQSLPHRREIFRAAGADFVAFSGHKMCGPTGVGVLCGRMSALERLRPVMLGGGTVDWVDTQGHRIRKVPHRFEYGTPDIAAVIGFGAALSYLDELGEREIREHDTVLANALLAECARRDTVRVIGPAPDGDHAGVVSMELPGFARLDEVARALSDSFGVMCRSGHMCAQPLVDGLAGGQVLRMSTYIYNSVTDVEEAFHCLDKVLEAL
nr:cysteine desulfurase [Actinoplanes digitatis]